MKPGATSATLRARLLQWPWYPWVVAIYPLWFLYLRNPGQVSPAIVVVATAIMLAVIVVLFAAAHRLLRSRDLGALATTVLIVGFYTYGPLHDTAVRLAVSEQLPTSLQFLGRVFENHIALSSLLLSALIIMVWLLVVRVDRNPARVTGACNVTAGVLVVALIFRLTLASVEQHRAATSPELAKISAGRKVSVLGYNPDIYYVILDGYARADVLREYYNFDNTPFITELERRGFSVNDRSNANYYWTFLSLASSLNFDYLQNFSAGVLVDPDMRHGRNGFGPIAQRLQDNRAAHFLRARGYRFVHLQSSAPETMRNPYADEEVKCSGRLFDDEYFRTVAEISWLKALALNSVMTAELATCHQLRLESLIDQARRRGPKFVFVHFLPPHHPYLFDRFGNVLRRVTISNQFDFQAKLWEDKPAYLEQLMYTNRSLLAVIDRIRAESERPPIIILQSDHGPNLRRGLTDAQAISLRLANFGAYLLPGAEAGTLPRDCAPVNQFRYLFNHYFEAGLPTLPNRSYISAFRTPLQMVEVNPSNSAGEWP